MTTNKKMCSLTALQNYALCNKGKVQKSIISNAEENPQENKKPHMHKILENPKYSQ